MTSPLPLQLAMKKQPVSYQLVIQFPGTYFSSFDEMVAFEDRLINCMPRTCSVDGHDIGSGTINFFIITGFPQAAHLTFRKYLGTNKVEKKVRIAFRDLASDDYVTLWPRLCENPTRNRSPKLK